MIHFESLKNVKKIQVVCSQLFITFSYFACTRPSAFYFGKMACISYNKCYFVSIIQRFPIVTYRASEASSYAVFLWQSWVFRHKNWSYIAFSHSFFVAEKGVQRRAERKSNRIVTSFFIENRLQ